MSAGFRSVTGRAYHSNIPEREVAQAIPRAGHESVKETDRGCSFAPAMSTNLARKH